jgi:beta-glucanase (GH16 family)/glycerophosphoryl diester phosphodiesterase
MKYSTLIALFLLVNFYSPIAKGQQSYDKVPVTLTNYTFNSNKVKSGNLTGLVFPKEKNITLSGKDAKWLFIKDHSVFIKSKFAKAALKEKKINFKIILKEGNRTVGEKSFTLLADQFHHNKVIAHRGAWKNTHTPQNSLASLEAAIALGCFGSETDVHMTADSALVINHDPVWGGLNVQKSTLADLRKTKLSNGELLPLLQDFLKTIKQQSSTKLILELKPSGKGKEWADATVQKVISTVHQMQAQAWLVYISFDYEMCKEILRLEPSANVQYLNGDKSPEQLKEDGIKGADYHYSVFQKHPEWIASAKKNNIDLNAWTVNEAKDLQWLLANDFDFITTNEPELLFKEIEKSPVVKGWKLVWSDEFDYTGLPDNNKWSYDVGGHGWGNNEKQYYTKEDTSNALVKNGVLSIVAKKEIKDNNEYTSARLLTKGKADWKYGRIEINAKLPAGRGLWPAGWMLNSNIDKTSWPEGGEIDIMEHIGSNKDSVYGTVHTGAYNHVKGTQKGTEAFIKNPYTQFHTFAIEWSPEKIDFLLDGDKYYSFSNEHLSSQEWPFDQPFFIILNLAIGGGFGGQKGIDDSVFPAVYQVDYVRVYQRK